MIVNGYILTFYVIGLLIGAVFPVVGIITLLLGWGLLIFGNNRFVLTCVASISKGYVVALRDFEDNIKLSVAYLDEHGEMTSYFYWSTNIKLCILVEGGKLDDGGYVKEWWYISNKKDIDYTKGWRKDGRA